jgi:hypothetical protein
MITDPFPLCYVLTVLRSPKVDGVDLTGEGFLPTVVDYKILQEKIASELAAGKSVGLLEDSGRRAYFIGVSRHGLFGVFEPNLSYAIPEASMRSGSDVLYLESRLPGDTSNLAHFVGKRRELVEVLSQFVPTGEETGGRDSLTDLQTILNHLNHDGFENAAKRCKEQNEITANYL